MGGGFIVVMIYYYPGKYQSQYHPDVNYEYRLPVRDGSQELCRGRHADRSSFE
jgi:hypothetical protein